MKPFLYVLFLIPFFSWAQNGFHYQAAVRNSSGNLITNQAVSFYFKIHKSSTTGPVLYEEEHQVSTNLYGLADLTIGQGFNTVGNLDTITWGGDSHFLSVEFDENGGSTYLPMSTTQLMAVPYAMHAQTVSLETQSLSLQDDSLKISQGNTVYLEPQKLTLQGDTLQISRGNEVILPSQTAGNASILVISGDITDAQAAALIASRAGAGTHEIHFINCTALNQVTIPQVEQLIRLRIQNSKHFQLNMPDLENILDIFEIQNSSVEFTSQNLDYVHIVEENSNGYSWFDWGCKSIHKLYSKGDSVVWQLNQLKSLQEASFFTKLDQHWPRLQEAERLSFSLGDGTTYALDSLIKSKLIAGTFSGTINAPLWKQGGLTISNSNVHLDLPSAQVLENLTIRRSNLNNLYLNELDTVRGEFLIEETTGCSEILANVKFIKGMVKIKNNSDLQTLSLADLNQIQSYFYLQENPVLQSAELPLLSKCSSIVVEKNQSLNQLNFNALDSIKNEGYNSIFIQENNSLSSVSFPNLKSAPGAIKIRYNENLTNLSHPLLNELGDSVSFLSVYEATLNALSVSTVEQILQGFYNVRTQLQTPLNINLNGQNPSAPLTTLGQFYKQGLEDEGINVYTD